MIVHHLRDFDTDTIPRTKGDGGGIIQMRDGGGVGLLARNSRRATKPRLPCPIQAPMSLWSAAVSLRLGPRQGVFMPHVARAPPPPRSPCLPARAVAPRHAKN
eukprot:scaffold5541_cov24-Tisochrysis_lutea.AAC.1